MNFSRRPSKNQRRPGRGRIAIALGGFCGRAGWSMRGSVWSILTVNLSEIPSAGSSSAIFTAGPLDRWNGTTNGTTNGTGTEHEQNSQKERNRSGLAVLLPFCSFVFFPQETERAKPLIHLPCSVCSVCSVLSSNKRSEERRVGKECRS